MLSSPSCLSRARREARLLLALPLVAVVACQCDEADPRESVRDASVADARVVLDATSDAGATIDAGDARDGGVGEDAAVADSGASFDASAPPDTGVRTAIDCRAVDRSAPIVLDDPTTLQRVNLGAAALAVAGNELAIAFADVREGDSQLAPMRYALQLRSPVDGALHAAVARTTTMSTRWFFGGTTALAWDPVTDRFAFAAATAPPSGAVQVLGLSRAGDELWATALEPACYVLGGSVDVHARPGASFEVTLPRHDCPTASGYGLWASSLDLDGQVLHGALVGPGVPFAGSSAYDPVADRVRIFWPTLQGTSDVVHTARIDPVQHVLTDDGTVPELFAGDYSIETTLAAFGEGRYGLVGERERFVQGVGIRYQTQFQVWDPAASTASTPLFLFRTDDARRLAGGRVLWTGAGWLVALTHLVGEGNLAPSFDDHPVVEIWRFDAEGALLERFVLDESPEAALTYFPALAWLDGRAAVTWVRRDAAGYDRHLLRFLECP